MGLKRIEVSGCELLMGLTETGWENAENAAVSFKKRLETAVQKNSALEDQAFEIDHLMLPTRDYLFGPSYDNICRLVDFIHKNAASEKHYHVHCKFD
ncbi:hypothetical protein C5167_022155 [Papaver somniferum]|uniref:Uncharacterized protein n=1 Tax=Papaver somniferum TaxID=3469 RepID=A0A4Y7JK22_PAPSO|nr:hypothetical protein C5167_022155 [Papaver somniferum]